ncbi:MFS efflux transporter [Pseudohyphozyma bogoriensis]|nr:MFS efflux transporter [Pseudohyphozyma bogoriensis]
MITSTAIKMVGFAFAGFANTHLTHKLGLGRVTTIGALVQAFGYIFLIPAFPFPIMPVVYGVLGFGMALQGAACNTYVATLPNPQQHFGFVHAAYGIGALVCPLAVTGWASAGHKFSYFYAVSLGLSCLNVAICLGAFRFNYRIEDTHAELDGQKAGHEDVELDEVSGGRVTGSEGGVVEKQGRERGALETVLRMRIMWVFCLFILVYVGAEVSTGGWIVTFVIDERNGGPSGYWGGLALGRLVLARVNVALGEKRSVFYYLSIVVGLELAIWFAHNLVANAVTVALVGFLIGPLYPNACSIATKVIPRHLHNSTLGFIGAFGQVGSAVFPFMTGALAQKYSTYALQPMMIVLSVVMMSVWWFVPEPPKKDE